VAVVLMRILGETIDVACQEQLAADHTARKR
jgi:hypothetical protein